MGVDNGVPLPDYITTLIEIKAKQLVGKHRFTRSDQDDLEQQISVEVVRRRARFDPSQAQENTFLARLVEHAVADIIAARKASNRDYRREAASLDRWVRDSGRWVRRVETVTDDAATLRTGQARLDHHARRDLELDVAEILGRLPAHLRAICRHLMTSQSVQEAADAADLHRSSIYDAIGQIREHFRAAGLEFYCDNPTVRRGRR